MCECRCCCWIFISLSLNKPFVDIYHDFKIFLILKMELKWPQLTLLSLFVIFTRSFSLSLAFPCLKCYNFVVSFYVRPNDNDLIWSFMRFRNNSITTMRIVVSFFKFLFSFFIHLNFIFFSFIFQESNWINFAVVFFSFFVYFVPFCLALIWFSLGLSSIA